MHRVHQTSIIKAGYDYRYRSSICGTQQVIEAEMAAGEALSSFQMMAVKWK